MAPSHIILSFVFSLSVILATGRSWAQNPPHLTRGHHVYTIPPSYIPPDVGQGGLRMLENAAQRAHQPWVILFVDQPAIRGTDEAFSTFVERLMTYWRTTQPQVFTTETHLLVLVRRPHRMRLVPGTRWTEQLALTDAQVAAYLPRPRAPTDDAPSSLATRVLASFQGFDAFVFQETDSAQLRLRDAQRQAEIAARARELQRQEEEREATARANARGLLNDQLRRAHTLRREDPDFLPDDLSRHDRVTHHAQAAMRDTRMTSAVITERHNDLRVANDQLAKNIREAKEEAARHTTLKATIALITLAIIIVLIVKAVRRRRLLRQLQTTLANKIAERRRREAEEAERRRQEAEAAERRRREAEAEEVAAAARRRREEESRSSHSYGGYGGYGGGSSHHSSHSSSSSSSGGSSWSDSSSSSSSGGSDWGGSSSGGSDSSSSSSGGSDY